jgi:hypothetical protein
LAQLLFLEDFAETPAQDDQLQTPPAERPDYQAGFEDGRAAAAADQAHLRAEVVQTLSEMSFGFAEAQQHALTVLAPLFGCLIEKLLPAMVAESFTAHVQNILLTAAADDIAQPVTLLVAPDQVSAMTTAVAAQTAMPVQILADKNLTKHAALISTANKETALDLDVLLADITITLSALREQPESQHKHG